MSRFSKIVPATPLELERFYLDTINKLQGTDASLDDIDQRSQSPVSAMIGEAERVITSIVKAAQAPLRAQISDLERTVRNLQSVSLSSKVDDLERSTRNAQSQSLSTKVDDLERRIDSIERSARY